MPSPLQEVTCLARLLVEMPNPSVPEGVLHLDDQLAGIQLPTLVEAVQRVVVVHDEEVTQGMERPAKPGIRADLTQLPLVLDQRAEL